MIAIRRGWFHLASGAGVGRVLGFTSNLLLSRWLGPTELGLFNLVCTSVQTSETLVRCGGDYALNFELGCNPEASNTQRGVDLARGFAQLCSLMTALMCVALLIWIWWGHGLFPISLATGRRLTLTCILIVMVACEGISASAWEILLVSHRTAPLALRQGFFFPVRLLFAAFGASFGGVLGAMLGWSLVALFQCIWLKTVLRHLWCPLNVWPVLSGSLTELFKRGFPFYITNLLASLTFYPMLLKVASASGLSEIGYLRVGQILQQLFAFLPATLVPVLFLKLRAESTFADQVSIIEKPLRFIWFLLLEILLLYCVVDYFLIDWVFGGSYLSALLPTRLLLVTSLVECLAQLVVQPILATGQTRAYGFWQNGAAILAACLGWLWIPSTGLAAYLIVRLLYVIVPLIGFGASVVRKLQEPSKLFPLAVVSIGLLVIILAQNLQSIDLVQIPYVFVFLSILLAYLQRYEILYLKQLVGGSG